MIVSSQRSLLTQQIQKGRTSVSSVGFEPATVATGWSQIYALERTVIAVSKLLNTDTDFSILTNMSRFINSLSSLY